MLYNASGILYAAHTGGQLGVPPRKGRWEIASLGKKQNVGAYPPPLVGHGGTVFEDLGDVISDKDVGLVTTTDASRVGSFKLVLATEPSRALAKNHQYDIDDRWNMYGASTKLTDLRAAATFCFAADHEHVSLEADRYLGLAVNCAQYVEGGSCCLLRSKNQPEGGSGGAWKINSDGTLSPKENKDLVLGFGPITYDSWNRREQTADSIGGAEFVAVGLVAPSRRSASSSVAPPPLPSVAPPPPPSIAPPPPPPTTKWPPHRHPTCPWSGGRKSRRRTSSHPNPCTAVRATEACYSSIGSCLPLGSVVSLRTRARRTARTCSQGGHITAYLPCAA